MSSRTEEIPDVESIFRGERRALARALTLIERGDARAGELSEKLRPRAGRARRILVTGPTGAGKSSLLREVLRTLRARGETAAVIACDPASPHSGGAFLGDRVRWAELGEDPGIFVRSIAQRPGSGAIAAAAWELADVLDAAGYAWVFVETVGAGQLDVPRVLPAVVRLLVLSPGSGDEIQMLKAGLMEAGDVYAVNKGDLGGDRWARELEETLAGGRSGPPVVVTTTASRGEGIGELLEKLERAAAERSASS